jgi:hypothetical protein
MDEVMEEQPAYDQNQMLSVCRKEIDSSLGWTGTRLTRARQRNLNEWFGNRRGDEVEGRSQASSRIVFEQVEQILPGLLEVFVSSNEVCTFVPQGPEDEPSARAATQACNHVFRKNNGLEILMTMFRDALIQRNGIVKVYWDEGQEGYFETYEGKRLDEVAMLAQDKHFEFRESVPVVMDEAGDLVELDEQEIDLSTLDLNSVLFTIKGVRRPDDGRVRIENVAPEDFLINRDAKGIEDPSARFLAQRIRTTVSQLIASGIDPELANSIPTTQPSSTTDTSQILRSSQQDGIDSGFADRTDSERSVLVTECYVLIDTDDDGISEWWRVLVAGEYAQKFISADPVDGHPFASVTPIPVPHRFYGLSLADAVTDIENIQTTLWRQYLDSLYLSTDPRMVVLSQGVGDTAMPLVNLNQLIDATPGSYVEEYAPGALRPLEMKTNAADILPALSLHREMLQSRTGVTPEGQGIDPSSINKTAYGVMVQQSAAAQRATLIARVFADTGVKRIFKLIYKELLQHGSEMQLYAGGEWVPINPGDWATNMDAQIAVGLGHGTRMEKVNNLQTLAAVQEKLLASGMSNMVTQQNLFATASAMVEALGFKEPEQFITDPSMNPPPPPQPDPADLAVQAQQQIESMKLEIDRQRLELERFKAMADLKVKELDHEIEVEKLNLQGASANMDDPWSIFDSMEGGDSAALISAVDQAMLSVMGQGGGENLQ